MLFLAFRRRRQQGLTIALLFAGLIALEPMLFGHGRGPFEAVPGGLWTMPSLAGFRLAHGEGSPSSKGRVVLGPAHVRDGDTIVVARTPVRLQGLHCPERGEPGGQAATTMMQGLVRGRSVSCRLNGERTYDRMVGRCEVGGQDLAASLIEGRVCARCARYDPWLRYLPSQLMAGPWSGSMPRYC